MMDGGMDVCELDRDVRWSLMVVGCIINMSKTPWFLMASEFLWAQNALLSVGEKGMDEKAKKKSAGHSCFYVCLECHIKFGGTLLNMTKQEDFHVKVPCS